MHPLIKTKRSCRYLVTLCGAVAALGLSGCGPATELVELSSNVEDLEQEVEVMRARLAPRYQLLEKMRAQANKAEDLEKLEAAALSKQEDVAKIVKREQALDALLAQLKTMHENVKKAEGGGL